MARDKSHKVDMKGLALDADDFTINGTSVAASQSAQTFSGAKTFDTTPILGTGTRIDLASTTATLSSNAATITQFAAVITTESLTTAHTATAVLTVTKTGVATGDFAMISLVGGTNTAGVPVFNALCSTDTVTVTLRNNAIITNAFNGTFIFNLIVFKS